MKAVILSGGLGTRFGAETATRPKPLIEVGGRPLLWHIMKLYAYHGVCEFILCAGYKAEAIADFFTSYRQRYGDMEVDLRTGRVRVLRSPPENWRVKIIDTGLGTETGGRIKRIRPFLKEDELFLMTYGDTLTDVDVAGSIAFHRDHGRLATMSVVSPANRFGEVVVKDGVISQFREKEPVGAMLLNAGFFVLHPEVLDYIEDDDTVWEKQPLERLASDGQLMPWRHDGFWQPMDTVTERDILNRLWDAGCAPWKVW